MVVAHTVDNDAGEDGTHDKGQDHSHGQQSDGDHLIPAFLEALANHSCEKSLEMFYVNKQVKGNIYLLEENNLKYTLYRSLEK